MSAIALGPRDWEMTRDEDGHRDYDLEWLVETSHVDDGPFMVLQAGGLPLVGSIWSFGNETDPYAFCHPTWRIRRYKGDNEPGNFWTVNTPFSTRPIKRCQDQQIENPMAEPPRTGGSFTKFTKERAIDRNGKLITSSSWELFRGAAVEFDDNRPNVSIGLNLVTLPLQNIAQLIDTLNDSNMWGLEPRMVKLSNCTWRRLLFGTCAYFYTVGYEFDIDFDTFDRELVDEGTKVLRGWGADDPIAERLVPDGSVEKDPKNFQVYKDVNGENTRALLDGVGRPLDDGEDPHKIKFEYYPEANLLGTLGLPGSL